MKTRYFLLLSLLTMCLSCDDYLDKMPLDKPSNETFYSNDEELLMAVNACYSYIGYRMQWPHYPHVFASDATTDILATRFSGTQYLEFKKGELSPNHTIAHSIWSNRYAGINRASSLLDNLKIDENSSSLAKRIRSEAQVIRSICYMELIQNYGDVPLIKSVINVNEALEITRTPKSEVLQFIYDELDEAVNNLPLKYEKDEDKGRITQGAAYAMKARIALYNKDWEIARVAAKACMDLNVYKLYPSYRDLFTYKGQNCDEIILDYQYMQSERETNLHMYLGTRNTNGQSQDFPTEDMIASFECTDGLPINESPLYDPRNPFANRDPRLWGAVIVPRIWDGETIYTEGTVFYGIEYMSSKETLYQADGKTILASSLSEKEKTVLNQNTGKMIANQEVTNAYSSFTGYCMHKYADEANVPTPNNCYNNFILCRYAEVLLIYAEASVESGKIDTSVLDAINMVRARAYGNSTSTGTDINAGNYPRITTTNAAELRKTIRRERKVELCFEGFRLEDLKRWGLLEKALNKRINYGRPENYSKLLPTDIPVIDDDGLVSFPYAEDRYGINDEVRKLRYYEVFGTITTKNYFLPIPLNEINLNPNLKQNPDY